MEWFNKFISILKIPLKILLPSLWIFSFGILFMPVQILEKINLYEWSKKNVFMLGLIFAITTSLIIVYIITYLLKKMNNFISSKTRNKKAIKAIENMSEYERKIILDVYKEKTYSAILDYANPVVRTLLAKRYLYMGNNVPVEITIDNRMPTRMTLQPFVRQALEWKYNKTIDMIKHLEDKLNKAKKENDKQEIINKIESYKQIEVSLRR